MEISYEKIQNGFSVKFPFELKDLFKQTFKSAKWNPENKAWVIGVRGEKKLQQWISEVTDIASDIETCKNEIESHELAEDEIKKIRHAINIMTLDLNNTLENIANANTKTRMINVEKVFAKLEDKLEKAKGYLVIANDELTLKVSKNKAILNSVINLDDVLKHQQIMAKEASKVGRSHKDNYCESQDVIIDAKDRLQALGFTSDGLNLLTYMNFNRYDRDKPQDITIDKILNLTAIDD